MTDSFITPEKADKPLKMKAYGSIGHLPNSRMGPSDHHVHEGQAAICTIKSRKGDTVIVTEKLDGSCMSVANIYGELVPLTRAGYRASDVTYPHLRAFMPYLEKNIERFRLAVRPGERIVGEWMPMAHGTIYDPTHPQFSHFIPFDIFRDNKRILYTEFRSIIERADMQPATCLNIGDPLSVEEMLVRLAQTGFHGATEPVEGAVWRVEREGRVDFLAKYVRPDKVDGKYFTNISGQPEIWFMER